MIEKKLDCSKRVLVVDDDPSQLRTLSDIFVDEGFTVVPCASFEDALAVYQDVQFAVAVVDLRLKDGNGIELLKQMLLHQRDVRVVIHTGHGSFDSAKNALNHGAFAFVEKLDDRGELIRHVHRAAQEFLSEALTKSENRFAELLDDIDAVVWESELPDFRVTFISNKLKKILGYPPEYWLDNFDNWIATLHDDDREWVVSHCTEMTKSGRDHELDYRLIHADGSVIWVHDIVHVVKDTDGRPIKSRGVLFDITARKNAEQALHESEDQRLRAEQFALLMTARMALDGTWQDVPAKLCELLGYSSDELVGRPVAGITFPDDRPIDQEQIGRLLNGEINTFEREKRFIKKDGSILWAYTNCSIVADSDNRPLSLLTYFRDISEQKVTEFALRESENRYRSLVHNAPVCIHEMDLSGNLTSMNPAGLKMLDADSEPAVCGLNYLDFVGEGDRDRIRALLQQAYLGKRSEFEFTSLKINEISRVFSSNFVPINDSNGNVQKLMGVTQEITERRKAESALRRSEEQFRQLAENVNAVFWMRSASRADQLYVSPKYEEIWGRSLGSMRLDPNSFMNAIVPEDRGRVIAAFEELRLGGRPEDYKIEYRIRKPDNEVRWIRDVGFSILDSNGNTVCPAGFAEDITESRMILENLRTRDLAIASANFGIVITDAKQDGCPIIDCNPAFEALTGYERSEVIGRNCRFLQGEDRDQQGIRELRHAIKSGQDCKTLLRNYRKNGSMFWNILSISPIHDESGELTHFVGFTTDITSRVDIENELKESEQRFRTIFEQAAVGVALFETVSGRFVRLNGRYTDLIGYSQAEMLQMTFMEITHPDDLQEDLDEMRRLQEGAISEFSIEKRLIRRNGTSIWVNQTVSSTWQPGEIPEFAIAIVQDITERKEIESALRDSERSLAKAQEMAGVGNWQFDIASESLFGSDEMQRIIGVKQLDMNRMLESLPEMIHHDDRKRVLASYSDAMTTGFFAPVEFRLNSNAHQPERFVRVESEVLKDRDGRPSKFVGTIQDITKAKIAEERQRKQELEFLHVGRLNTMGEMVAGIAHEINQPLHTISTYSAATRRSLDSGSDNCIAKAQKWANEISKQVVRASGIIARLRDFCQLNPSNCLAVDINVIIRESIELLTPEARYAHTRIETKLKDDLPFVAVDRVQIQQVLVNLIKNAWEAMLALPISDRVVVVRSTCDESNIIVSVIDHGPGLNFDDSNNLFDAFYTTKENGLGIGLAVSKTIIESHGGSLSVKPNSRNGTVFSFSIPSILGTEAQ